RIRNMPVSLDMETLKAIAEQTGGQAFRATDQNSLVEIYAEIDALERTEYQETRWEEVRDDGPLMLGFGLMLGLFARLLGASLWPEVAS
ncbi:MAG TPA: aerotolerance regulator BatA, partial [Phycisphaerales bacterium]|nr:aerotolerance regulator BatA [Phycisphaerales bacterium]